jgi:glycosyltransferase involved in cell wall biosynthesis
VGFVVPLGDAAGLAARLAALAEDSALCKRLGERGRAWVEERFTNAQLAANTGRVYRDAARGRSGAAERRAPA